jgi:PIN domain nuclease of toxin-antitoxin system
MRLLLDTCAFMWFIGNDPRLSPTAQSLIADPANERLLSIASLWEIALKISRAKLTLHVPFEAAIYDQLDLNQIQLLNLSRTHLGYYSRMPFQLISGTQHKDPFDRIIISQALVEAVPVLTSDGLFDHYPDLDKRW